MYGLDLPDDVLKKIYYKNALRIIPGIDPSVFGVEPAAGAKRSLGGGGFASETPGQDG